MYMTSIPGLQNVALLYLFNLGGILGDAIAFGWLCMTNRVTQYITAETIESSLKEMLPNGFSSMLCRANIHLVVVCLDLYGAWCVSVYELLFGIWFWDITLKISIFECAVESPDGASVMHDTGCCAWMAHALTMRVGCPNWRFCS